MLLSSIRRYKILATKGLIITAYHFVLICSLALCLLISGQVANARLIPQQIKFTHLSTKEGLAQNTVRALAQDNEGFIWIATQSGLHRYDGYKLQSYSHNPHQPTSIASNLVIALTSDNDGFLWAGTFPAAINRFNPAKGNFDSIQFPPLKTRGLIKQLLSTNNFLWIAIDNQFFTLNKAESVLQPFSTINKVNEKAVAIIDDHHSDLWLVKETGVYSIENTQHTIKKEISFQFPENDRIASAVLKDGVFYFGTIQGNLYNYNIEHSFLEKIWSLPEKQRIGASSEFSSIAISNNNIWITSISNGLIKYSLNNKDYTILIHDEKNHSSIADNNLRSILIDKSGLIWVGTSVSGVERTTGESGPFSLYQDTADEDNITKNNDIRAFLVTKDKQYWLAPNEGILKRFYPDSNQYTSYVLPKPSTSPILNIGPSALVETSSGDILYGSKYGFWKFSRSNESFSEIAVFDKHGVDGKAILSFHKDNQGQIWVGSSNAGVGLYDESLEQIEWFPAKGEVLKDSSNFVMHFADAYEDLIWVGSSKGLTLFNTLTFQYQKLHISDESNLLDNAVIRTLYQTPSGDLWVGTLSGVFFLQRKGELWQISYPFSHIKSLNGNIYAFLRAPSRNLWISSNYGLTKVSPDTGEYQTYTSHDGLQGEEFNGNIAFKTNDHRLWFGGLNGLNAFNPEKIHPSNFQPPLWITGYQIDDKFKQVTNPAFFTQLTLPKDSQLLRLEFSSLDYTYPERNQYRIKLDSSEKEWLDLGGSHEITYTKLLPGTYKTCFVGTNQDGVWNEECRSLLITLETPFWKTSFAYFLYFIIFLMLALIIFYLQKRKMIAKLKIHNQIKNSKEQLSWALEGSGDALWIWDVKQGKAFRQGINSLLGYKPNEIQNLDIDFESVIHPDDLPLIREHITTNIKTHNNAFYEMEYRMKSATGKWLWILDRGKIVARDKNGQATKIAGTFKDISNRKIAEEASELSALIIRNMAEMVIVTDENFRILSANPSWCHIMGYQLYDLVGKDPSIFNSSEIAPEFYQSARKHLIKFGNWQGEMPHKKKNQEEILTSLEMTLIRNPDQSIRHIVAVCSDITEKKRAEKELRHLANYDMLTNLPNRTLFLDRLEHAILQADRHNTTIALLFIDLDNFKNINDSLGHNCGDRLLIEAAKIISNCVRMDDTVSRLGGDEFTVILENISDGVAVFHIAEKIIKAFEQAIQVNTRMISITPSIGISLYPDDANTASLLVQYADTAMYFAKSQGRNNFQFYAEEMNKNSLRRLEIEGYLRTAMDNQEFHIAYQPKVETITGKISGMEALLRWTHPDIGQISPVEFIPLAEDSGLIVAIGEWVLLQTCLQAKKWVDMGNPDLNVSVNLSFRQFKAQDLPEIVEKILHETGLQGQNLTLEITESLLMDNVDKATQQLQQLKQLGVKIAIDDFGTGYSSLNYLKQFPLDYLKIDRTFISDVLTNQNDASLTSAIIALSHNLQLAVIAEGVELIEQLAFLKKAGCEEIQGFLVSPPVAGPLFESLLIKSKDKNVFELLQK